jgi:hypothetical protein
MSAAQPAAGLLATAFLLAPAVALASEKPVSGMEDAPVVSVDFGGGMMQPSYTSTQFTTLDTFYGQHTYYHSMGPQLGLARPVGFLMNMTMHVYPFAFRGVGFVATGELGGFTSALVAGTTPFGAVDTTNNFYASGLVGPEAQMRVSSLFFRAGLLGGGRYTSIGDYNATEWRVTLRGQLDYAFGDPKRNDAAFTFGLFAGTDFVPSFGWQAGLSLTLAFL